ncbi:ATP-binding protein [Hyalangium minutum]|uniref:histidine kinase n=1 Tax=Hyalangium minutum TaxID=394096 RepID=A0A085W5D8_9BACT|nr:ATP-binding protein [Hyalangium minutum]KFE62901.1 PAS/PAC domain protein [Hyalangium minutum]
MPSPDFGQLFRFSPNPYMVLDRELKYVAANDAYLRVTASRLEDLLGRNVFDLFPHDPANPSNENARMLRASFERVLSSRASDTLALIMYRVPLHTEAGIVIEERFWSATHTPLLDEKGEVAFILQHTVDVTELQRLKQAVQMAEAERSHATDLLGAGVLQRAQQVQETNRTLDAERRHLLQLFEQAPGFMTFLRGRHHVFELANRAYYQVVGHRELIGKPVREALPELAGQGFYELLDKVFTSGEPFVGRGLSVALQRQPGAPLDERSVDFVYQPIFGANGAVTGIFVQGHDMTERRKAEEEVKRLNQTLERRVQARTAELVEANKELESFSYSVSHDLRAPLRHITGFAQLLERRIGTHLDATSREYMKTISDAARQGGKMVDDLLNFSRMGRAELKKTQVSLDELISQVRRELAPEAEGRTVTWKVAALPQVQGDPALLRLVFKNLLSNALKYTRPKPEPTIEVDSREEEGDIHVWVKDNGVGFEMEYVDKLFGVFQRLHTADQFEGTGIGLANVRRIVARHGGRTWAEGKAGEGATFHFTLPAAASEKVST